MRGKKDSRGTGVFGGKAPNYIRPPGQNLAQGNLRSALSKKPTNPFRAGRLTRLIRARITPVGIHAGNSNQLRGDLFDRAHRVERYHSTNLGMPSRILV